MKLKFAALLLLRCFPYPPKRKQKSSGGIP